MWLVLISLLSLRCGIGPHTSDPEECSYTEIPDQYPHSRNNKQQQTKQESVYGWENVCVLVLYLYWLWNWSSSRRPECFVCILSLGTVCNMTSWNGLWNKADVCDVLPKVLELSLSLSLSFFLAPPSQSPWKKKSSWLLMDMSEIPL